MHISELAYKRRTIFWFLIAIVVIGGIYSFWKISKLEDPEIIVMQAMVVTIYPGASAHEVELQVTNVLENEIRSLNGISEIKSTSSANMSQISVLLKFSVPEKEITQYWDVLRRKVKAATAKLPSGAMEPMVIDDFGDVYGIFYGMTGDGYSYDEMNKYANYIKREMLMLEGVKRVEIFGNQPSNIDIELSPEKMAQLGIYPAQIVLALNSQSSPVYAGAFQQGDHNIRLTVDKQIQNIGDIENLTIKGFEGDLLKLGDIATIKREQQEPSRFTMLYNDKNALGISISMESGENIVEVGKKVEARLAELMQTIPIGIQINKIFYQPDKVDSAINDFMWNLVISVILVVLVLMFTMGFRSGVIIGIGLIITILASFPILVALGGTLQRISLGAFVVAMGMLVDNTIVVMDGIIVDLQSQKGIKYSLFNTAKKTAMPLLCATSIAVIAFLPVYLSPDTAGVYIKDLFIVLCISLAISWVLALTQVPVFAAYMLDFRKIRNKKTEPFNGKLFQLLRKTLHYLMDHKLPTLIGALGLMAIALYGFRFTKQTFFPDFTYNQCYVEYTLPKDVSTERTIADMHKISTDLLKMEGIENVTASHGMTPSRYCLVRAVNQIGDNYAEFIIDFKDYKTMQKMRKQIDDYLYENYPDANARSRLYNLSILASHTVEVEFSGPDPVILRDLAKQAEHIMRTCPEVNHHTVCVDLDAPSKSLVAHYSEAAARQLGTSRSDVSNALLAATEGLPIGTLWEDDQSIPINLKLRNSDGSRIKDLKNIPVWNMIPNMSAIKGKDISNVAFGIQTTGELQKQIVSPIPLNQVVNNIDINWEETIVHRTDGRRTIQAQCDPIAESSPATVREEIKEAIESIQLPQGYAMRWVGEYNLSQKALKNIIGLLPLAVILIVFALILLFNDVRKTVIVLLCLPLAAIGIVPGLLIFDQPFSFVAIVGTIGMAGMLIKNSIVLIEEIGHRMREGSDSYNAIIDATVSRTRPVMMASLTTILGMIPLLPDPMYGPLAVTIMCGLFVGTIITLVLLPLFYALFFNVQKVN